MKQFLRDVGVKVVAAWLSPSVLIFGAAGYLCWKAAPSAKQDWANLNSTTASLKQTTSEINQPDKSTKQNIVQSLRMGLNDTFASVRVITRETVRPCEPGPCGLIPGIALVAKNTGSAVDVISEQAANSGKLVDAATTGLNRVTTSGSNLLDTVNVALKDKKNGLGATMAAYREAGTNLNSLLVSHAVSRMLDNAADLSGHLSVVAGNLQVTTGYVNHYLQPILQPTPCPKKGHLTCEIRRHLWTGIVGTTRTGEALYWTRQNF